MNKLIVIFTIIGILILFWFCFSSKQVPVEIDINAGNSPPIKIKENFEPNAMTKKIIENNSNNKIKSNFEGGQHLKEHTTDKGQNLIVTYPNPGVSSWVLRQSFDVESGRYQENELFYEISLNLEPNKFYTVSSVFGLSGDWQFSEFAYRIIFSENYNPPVRNDVIPTNPNILDGLGKIEYQMEYQNMMWYYNSFGFKTPSFVSGKVRIQIGYMDVVTTGYRYITAISIKETIAQNNNFPIPTGLDTFLDASNIQSYPRYGNVWKDMSGNGNDFSWKNKPTWTQSGFFKTLNNTLEGPSGFKLLQQGKQNANQQFSIFFDYKSFTKNVDNVLPILTIYGNQNIALQINLPVSYGQMNIQSGSQNTLIPYDIMTNQQNIYGVTYDGSVMSVYINSEKVMDYNAEHMYFNNRPVLINPTGENDGINRYFLFYNIALNEDNVNYLSTYLNRNIVLPPTNNIETNDGGMIGYIFGTPSNVLPMKKKTTPYSSECCSEQYRDKGCKIIYDPVSGNDVCGYVKHGKLNKCDDGCCYPEDCSKKTAGCPDVKMKNNDYIVKIEKGSDLAQKVGWSGERNYGNSREKARYIFENNFPWCPLPDILDRRKYNPDISECPFIIHDNNPCKYYECRNINWNETKLGANEKCKKRIDSYCNLNYNYDPACYCWNPKNYSKNRNCQIFRGKFEDPAKCDFRKHSIENHPDSKDYIRKDKIPCWNCNLTAPSFGINKDPEICNKK